MAQKRPGSETSVKQQPSRDEAAALEAAGGDADLARELVETLVQSLPDDLEKLRDSFATKDWPNLAATAHRMRGATSYCGAPALDGCLQALEVVSAGGDSERVRLVLLEVEREAKRLTRAVIA